MGKNRYLVNKNKPKKRGKRKTKTQRVKGSVKLHQIRHGEVIIFIKFNQLLRKLGHNFDSIFKRNKKKIYCHWWFSKPKATKFLRYYFPGFTWNILVRKISGNRAQNQGIWSFFVEVLTARWSKISRNWLRWTNYNS